MSDWEDDDVSTSVSQMNISEKKEPTFAEIYSGSAEIETWNSVSQSFGQENSFSDSHQGRGGGRGRGRGSSNFGGDRQNGGQGARFGGGGCHNCGERGHMKRDCPKQQNQISSFGNEWQHKNDFSGGRGGSRGCHNCGQDGHMKRDCPNGRSEFSSGNNQRNFKNDFSFGGGGGGSGCHNCGEDGHMKRDCPNGRSGFSQGRNQGSSRSDFSSGGNSFNRSGCHNCGEDGHMKRDCPNASSGFSQGRNQGSSRSNFSSGGNSFSSSGCHNCGEDGHMKRDCPNPPKDRGAAGDKPAPQTYVPVEMEENDLFGQGVSAGSNFSAFDSVAVQVSGSGDIPEKIEEFSALSLRPILLENVQKAGYERPLPIQKHSIPIIMGGRDIMSCAQTGSGKTAAFLLPIIHYIIENNIGSRAYEEPSQPVAVIVGPTRELVIQIYNEARKFSLQSVIKVSVVYGGTSVAHQYRNLQKGCHILVATPGRLLDYVEKSYINFERMKFLVLDEADRMLDMGFKSEIEKIVNHPSTPNKMDRQTLMFSATFPKDIQELSKKYLNDYVFVVTGIVGGANVDVTQTILAVKTVEKRETLLKFVKEKLEEKSNEKILVFVEQKRMADFIAAFLSTNEISTTSIHGDRYQNQREEALMEFKKGIRKVLVATAVAARGLDIKGVGIVVNYDMPKEIDEYVHRIGRTGRVGNPGTAISYFDTTVDAAIAKNLVKLLSDAEKEVPDWLIESAHSSDSVMSFEGVNQFGAKDIRNRVTTEEFTAAPTYAGGPSKPAASDLPEDEFWD